VDECFRLGKINLEGIGMVRNLVAEISEEVAREKYLDERGKQHLSCPACHDDCVGWIVDGKPCSDEWEVE
jgi:hypothetical protein